MDNNRGVGQATAEEHGIELVRRDSLASMSENMEVAPERNNELAGESSCSIFRVPQALAGGIAQASRPRIVSIGPYHHGEPQVQMLQEHKQTYLQTMLDQIQPHGVHLGDLINTVAPKVEIIRQCYSESTKSFSGPDLMTMMVVDGCFIIQFLRQLAQLIRMDPPLNNLYVLYSVARDLLRLENQVPYFVLEDLFEKTNVPEVACSLANLASKFFNSFDVGADFVLPGEVNIRGVHLLDSFRLNLIPQGQQGNPVVERPHRPLIRSASELRRVGIRFKREQANTFLGIKIDRKHRTVGIPQIAIDDDLNCILRNMVAYEQCRGQGGHITAYATFMGCLIDTAEDVKLLRDRKVISNHGMSNEDVACFFSDIYKDTTINIGDTYLLPHFLFLGESSKCERVYLCWAQLRNSFHDNPWSALSGLAIVVTLVGIIQTLYAVLQYHHAK